MYFMNTSGTCKRDGDLQTVSGIAYMQTVKWLPTPKSKATN
ncbi:hypothetical protein [Neobacillus drentensis]